MPYTEAILLEALRFGSILPLGILHATTQDVQFQDYFLPKDTVVISNIYAAAHDVKTWGDPGSFRPSRFILPGGDVDRNHESVIPFSVGKRFCLGEKLARDTLFLFVTTLSQKFKVSFDPSRPIPAMSDPTLGVVLSPKPHYLILEEQ